MSWLDDLLFITDEVETPKSYMFWSGMACIAAVVKNRVYLKKGGAYKLSPNIFVLLLGDSGLKKSFATATARRLVSLVNNTRIIYGRNSIQAIIKDLSQARTSEKGQEIMKDASGFLVSGELANLIIEDPQASTVLVDFYDSHYNEEWKNMLKGSGTEELKNLSVTLLGASNQTNLEIALPPSAYTGGLLARILVIYEENRAKLNPMVRETTKDIDLSFLAKHLKTLSNIEGKFILSNDALDYFEEWYKEFYGSKRDDKTGYVNRLNDHALKTSMLLALAEGTNLLVTKKHIESAIDLCMGLNTGINRIIAASGGKSEFGPKIAIFVDSLLKAPNLSHTRTMSLRKCYGDIDAYELDRVVETLNQMKAITITNLGGEVVYTLNPWVAEQYQKFKEVLN